MSNCDIIGCKNKSTGTYEDMEDGEWIDLCDYHAKELERTIR